LTLHVDKHDVNWFTVLFYSFR